MTKRFLVAAGIIAASPGQCHCRGAATPTGPGFRGGPGGPGPRPGGPPDLGLRGVQLSDEQREQVRNIMESHRAELDAVGAKIARRASCVCRMSDAATIDEAWRPRRTPNAAGVAFPARASTRGRDERHSRSSHTALGCDDRPRPVSDIRSRRLMHTPPQLLVGLKTRHET